MVMALCLGLLPAAFAGNKSVFVYGTVRDKFEKSRDSAYGSRQAATPGTKAISPSHDRPDKIPDPAPSCEPGGRNRICLGHPVGSPLPAHVQQMMRPSTVLNAPKCGSRAHRPTHLWQNLLPKEELNEVYSNMFDPPHTVNDMRSGRMRSGLWCFGLCCGCRMWSGMVCG